MGCVGDKYYLKKDFSPPAGVAILPINNHTTDMDGPSVVRYWLGSKLAEKKGYDVRSFDATDGFLKELGVTDGGQLAAVSVADVCRKLGVDALIYGDLLDFAYQTTGFINARKVRARFRMHDCKTGERIWEAEGVGASSKGALSGKEALKAGLSHLGTQFFDKASGSPLKYEAMDMAWDAIQFLPRAR